MRDNFSRSAKLPQSSTSMRHHDQKYDQSSDSNTNTITNTICCLLTFFLSFQNINRIMIISGRAGEHLIYWLFMVNLVIIFFFNLQSTREFSFSPSLFSVCFSIRICGVFCFCDFCRQPTVSCYLCISRVIWSLRLLSEHIISISISVTIFFFYEWISKCKKTN